MESECEPETQSIPGPESVPNNSTGEPALDNEPPENRMFTYFRLKT